MQVKERHASRPWRSCHLIEITSLLSFVSRTTLQSLLVEDTDIPDPRDIVCVFALIFINDSKQADNVATQLQGILEAART